MIFNTQFEIETYFQNNWVGEIQYTNTDSHPSATSWIYVDVEPIATTSANMRNGDVMEESSIYVTCYAEDKVAAAKLADQVIDFLQSRRLGDLSIGVYRPINRGEVFVGSYFYKIGFPVTVLAIH